MTEATDKTAAITPAWVFYDRHCPICRATLERWHEVFEKRRIEFAPLQAEWVRERLGLADAELPAEMKLLIPDGRILGGPVALAWMCRRVWWLWPAGMLMDAPFLRWLTRKGYAWLARNRYCLGDVCQVPVTHAGHGRHHAATTFLELP
jgi:predicted DCC family thiol-disulfide oxidoreductase YuxK